MPPTSLSDLRSYIERTQSALSDPAERVRALAVIERDLKDLLGIVATYRNDAQLQTEGQTGNSDSAGDAVGPPSATA